MTTPTEAGGESMSKELIIELETESATEVIRHVYDEDEAIERALTLGRVVAYF